MMVTSLILLRHSTSSISICESVTSSLSPKRLLSHYPGSQPLVPANHILLQWITPHAESAYAQLQQDLPISLQKVVLSRLLNSITKDTHTQYGGGQTQFRIGRTDFDSGTYSTMPNGRCHHITFQTLHQYLDSANQCMWLYGQSLWLHSAYAVNLVELIPKYGDWVYHFSLLGQRVSVSKGSNFFMIVYHVHILDDCHRSIALVGLSSLLCSSLPDSEFHSWHSAPVGVSVALRASEVPGVWTRLGLMTMSSMATRHVIPSRLSDF